MTLEEFAEIARKRLPTAEEFVAFVEAMGWRIQMQPNGRASLRAPAKDPLAVNLARMLGREPLRTQVLDLLTAQSGKFTTSSPVEEVVVTNSLKGRQWRWRFGQVYTETPDDPRFGIAEEHPVGAIWWREQNGAWLPVPGRESEARKYGEGLS